jgi:hypothetical protein
MIVIPWSIAVWIVPSASRMSVPPHIHPPIAHVPSAIREATIPVSLISMLSIWSSCRCFRAEAGERGLEILFD